MSGGIRNKSEDVERRAILEKNKKEYNFYQLYQILLLWENDDAFCVNAALKYPFYV